MLFLFIWFFLPGLAGGYGFSMPLAALFAHATVLALSIVCHAGCRGLRAVRQYSARMTLVCGRFCAEDAVCVPRPGVDNAMDVLNFSLRSPFSAGVPYTLLFCLSQIIIISGRYILLNTCVVLHGLMNLARGRQQTATTP
jgi:hypothetical protein